MYKNFNKWHFDVENDKLVDLVLEGKKTAYVDIYNGEKEELNSEALAKMAKDWQNKANIARDKKNAWKNDYDLENMKKEAEKKAEEDAESKRKQPKNNEKETYTKAENYEVYDPNGKLIAKYGKNGKRKRI